MLKELSKNILFLEALEQMLGYANFIKDLITKKKVVTYEDISGLHHYSVITSRSLAQKNVDLELS